MKYVLPLLFVVACASGPKPEHVAITGDYAKTQAECVDLAKTKDEAIACACSHPAANGHTPFFCEDGGAK